MTLGAYLQVFKNDGRANHVLRCFRRFYPSSPVCLLSDRGDSFLPTAFDYNCHYIHACTNTGVSLQGFTKQRALTWLLRLKQAFEYCNTDYLLYLEDDVLIRKIINIDMNWDIAGLYANPIPPQFLKPSFNTSWYGACGGTLYSRNLLTYYYDFVSMIRNDQVPYTFLDMFMPVLYMNRGLKYSLNTELTEPKRNLDWLKSHHSIIHDVKDIKYYG